MTEKKLKTIHQATTVLLFAALLYSAFAHLPIEMFKINATTLLIYYIFPILIVLHQLNKEHYMARLLFLPLLFGLVFCASAMPINTITNYFHHSSGLNTIFISAITGLVFTIFYRFFRLGDAQTEMIAVGLYAVSPLIFWFF